ncbi:MAG: type II secretion system protein N [Rhodoferax sp.]|nr:type II secretion system protein N [Rhodoferax sp.]
MATLELKLWPARLSTFLLAALAAASLVYWGLRWSEPVSTPRASSDWSNPRAIDTGRVAQLLGATATPANSDDSPVITAIQYKLLGVIAQERNGGFGSALIAMGDEKAKPFKVGDHLSDELVLQSVSARGAILATSMRAPQSIKLDLPPLATIKP